MKAKAKAVPSDVDKKLRKKADSRQIILNARIVEESTLGTAVGRKKIDLSDVVGKWKPDPEFEAAIASQRQIDREKWK